MGNNKFRRAVSPQNEAKYTIGCVKNMTRYYTPRNVVFARGSFLIRTVISHDDGDEATMRRPTVTCRARDADRVPEDSCKLNSKSCVLCASRTRIYACIHITLIITRTMK